MPLSTWLRPLYIVPWAYPGPAAPACLASHPRGFSRPGPYMARLCRLDFFYFFLAPFLHLSTVPFFFLHSLSSLLYPTFFHPLSPTLSFAPSFFPSLLPPFSLPSYLYSIFLSLCGFGSHLLQSKPSSSPILPCRRFSHVGRPSWSLIYAFSRSSLLLSSSILHPACPSFPLVSLLDFLDLCCYHARDHPAGGFGMPSPWNPARSGCRACVVTFLSWLVCVRRGLVGDAALITLHL